MTATSYQPVQTSKFYEVSAPDARGWVGYLLTSATSRVNEDIPFDETLNETEYAGHYFFAHSRPTELDSDPDKFAQTIYAALDNLDSNGSTFTGRAVAWFVLEDSGAFSSIGFYSRVVKIPLQGILVQNNENLALGSGFSFFVNVSATLGYSSSAVALRFSASGAALVGFTSSTQTPFGLGLAGTTSWSVNVPLTGDYAGCFTMDAVVKMQYALPYFQIGLQYLHVAGTPSDPPIREVFPLFAPSSQTYDMAGVLDPLDVRNTALTDEDRTAGMIRSGFFFKDNAPIASTFRTTQGKQVGLAPFGQGLGAYAGGLAFAQATDDSTNIRSDFQLCPIGDYALTVDGVTQDTDGQRLLPGLFGSEFLTFTTQPKQGKGDVLRWRTNQPAYAPVYPFAPSSMSNPDSGKIVERMNDTFMTPWATLLADDDTAISYSAQPAGAPLYATQGERPVQTSGDDGLLGSMPPKAALPTSAGFAMPMVPYSAVAASSDGTDLGQFESQILSATRKTLISPTTRTALANHRNVMLASDTLPTTFRATTPQGLLAEVPDTGHGPYQKVTVAKPEDAAAPDFGFCNLTDAMTDALQTNQLFLVAVNNAELGDLVSWNRNDPPPDCTAGGPAQFLNTIDIADWTFVASVGQGVLPTSYRSVLILKFCDGPLTERLKNPNQWTFPQDFSIIEGTADASAPLALTGLSTWLQGFVADGIEKSQGTSEDAQLYKNFAKMVQKKDWNGFMVLNADLPLSALPDQIAGIGAGIDPQQFLGHHFGSTVSRVKPDANGLLQIDGVSSLFGLIDYANPVYKQAIAGGASPDTPVQIDTTDEGYGFSVLKLQVQFAQAKLKVFRSRIQLSLSKIFESPITTTTFDGQGQGLSAMVLNGSAVTQNDETVYVFEEAKPYVFVTNTPALNAVSVGRVQFNTLSIDPNGQVASRFLIWGNLNFTEMEKSAGEPFDVLSFGSGLGGSLDSGLNFSNLQINMSYIQATPDVVNYTFNPESIAFNVVSSDLRDATLYDGLALNVTGFIAAPDGKQPADYGYLPVTPEGLSVSKLKGPWYGISYKIDMGSPGALVSGAGFSSSMLAAWAPGDTRGGGSPPQIFLGLSLPGAAPGASAFSLQGVVKLSTGAIKLAYEPGADGVPTKSYYTLRLEDIGIKVLGFLKLPPAATIKFFLFGDPNGSGSLGWWASYIQDDASNTLEKVDEGASQ